MSSRYRTETHIPCAPPPGARRRPVGWRTMGSRRGPTPAVTPTRIRAVRHRDGAATPCLALLGPPRVRSDGAWRALPPGRWVALLAYVARAGGWVRREALAAQFWPDHDRHRASWNLRQTLQTIARSAAGGAFEREATRVAWRGASDVAAFDLHVRVGDWRAAVASYGGTFLDGLEVSDGGPVQDWLDAERAGLGDRWRTAVLAFAEERLRDARPHDALELADRLIRHDPLDEAAVRLAMRAAAGCGDRQRGARAFSALQAKLQSELGLDPERETCDLRAALTGAAPPH
jgi:DNA-binding SARP family transcriptional activator